MIKYCNYIIKLHHELRKLLVTVMHNIHLNVSMLFEGQNSLRYRRLASRAFTRLCTLYVNRPVDPESIRL